MPKTCNQKGCGEQNLEWNIPLHDREDIWRLAKVTRLENGTLHYEPHDCPAFRKKEEPIVEQWVRPSVNGWYCAKHNLFLIPQDYGDGVCSECKKEQEELVIKGIILKSPLGRPAVTELIS